MTLRQSGLHSVGQGLRADALHGGDVGPVARSEQDGTRGDHSMKELLLRWTPRRHDDVAGSSVTIGAVILRPFEPDHISDERHQCAARISITGIYRFTWTVVFVNIQQKGRLLPTIDKEKKR